MIIWLFTFYYITSLSVILSQYTNDNKIEDVCIEYCSDDTCSSYDETEPGRKDEFILLKQEHITSTYEECY